MNTQFALSMFLRLLMLVAAVQLVACGKSSTSSSDVSSSAGATANYVCLFEDKKEETRFEFRAAELANEGLFIYRYSPVGNPAVVEGRTNLKLAAASWDTNAFVGNDSVANVKLTVPRNPIKGAAYATISIRVDGNTYEPQKFLECKRAP